MQQRILIIFVIVLFGCRGPTTEAGMRGSGAENHPVKPKEDPPIGDSSEIITSLHELQADNDTARPYAAVKRAVDKMRRKLHTQTASTDSLAHCLKYALLNRIIPFWEGTKWSFPGHTATPGEGKTGCSYFISTTLRDAGLAINRYDLAKLGPRDAAEVLAMGKPLLTVATDSLSQKIAKIHKHLKPGIHFIGFAKSHVGYLLKENGQLYLIHANYMNPQQVEIERARESEVFFYYKQLYIAEISTNVKLVKHWASGKQITVNQ